MATLLKKQKPIAFKMAMIDENMMVKMDDVDYDDDNDDCDFVVDNDDDRDDVDSDNQSSWLSPPLPQHGDLVDGREQTHWRAAKPLKWW